MGTVWWTFRISWQCVEMTRRSKDPCSVSTISTYNHCFKLSIYLSKINVFISRKIICWLSWSGNSWMPLLCNSDPITSNKATSRTKPDFCSAPTVSCFPFRKIWGICLFRSGLNEIISSAGDYKGKHYTNWGCADISAPVLRSSYDLNI